MEEVILKINNLNIDFKVKRSLFGSDRLSAVHNVNLEVKRGEIYGLVGESGCGKTTLANAILGFVPITSGSMEIFGLTVDGSTKAKEWRKVRRHLQTIFQDPYTSLDPGLTVWQIISEPLFICGERNENILKDRSESMLEKVGLGISDIDRHIFEFSGGQRQRIAIARALISGAEFIICDEPTTALDVSVHSQICNLLLDLQQELGLTYFFISHNLSLIKHITQHMSVMYLGEIMESGNTKEIFERPACPYTEALMSAILDIRDRSERENIILSGETASPINPPNLCRFLSRCPKASDVCHTTSLPTLQDVGIDHNCCCHTCNIKEEIRNGKK